MPDFSEGADSSWNQTIAPAEQAPSRDRREGAFRFDGSGWNYWQADGQKCWGKRRYPQCS